MRRLAAAATALLAVLVLAACTGDGDGGPDEAAAPAPAAGSGGAGVLVASADEAAEQGSARIAFTAETAPGGEGEAVTIGGEGEIDYEGRRARLSYDVGELLGVAGAAAEEPVELVLDGDVVYVKFSLLSALVPGAKEWLRIDLAALAAGQGVDLAQLQQLGQADPSQTLEYLRAVGDVEEVGAEEVRGVATAHYRGVVDLDRAAGLAPEESRAEVRRSVEQLKAQTGIAELPVDVWVDGDGLPRRIAYAYEGSLALAGTAGSDVSTSFTVEFYDYGVDVVVEPPPAGEVTDLDELAGEAGGAGS